MGDTGYKEEESIKLKTGGMVVPFVEKENIREKTSFQGKLNSLLVKSSLSFLWERENLNGERHL